MLCVAQGVNIARSMQLAIGIRSAPTTEMNTRCCAAADAFLAAARSGDFSALLAVLDPDGVLRADHAAVQMGAAPETRGAAGVAEFSRRARGARPALLDGAAAAVWMRSGRHTSSTASRSGTRGSSRST
jgi:hypothetical protein